MAKTVQQKTVPDRKVLQPAKHPIQANLCVVPLEPCCIMGIACGIAFIDGRAASSAEIESETSKRSDGTPASSSKYSSPVDQDKTADRIIAVFFAVQTRSSSRVTYPKSINVNAIRVSLGTALPRASIVSCNA